MKFLIGGGGGQKKSIFVASGEATDNSNSTDRGVNDLHMISELRLKDRVEVLRATNTYQTIGVCELGENTNLIRVLELGTGSHGEERKMRERERERV